jgi:sugar phosphate isomerase/epimerase
MFRISAFADEIDSTPEKQIEVLKQCDVRHVELRSILQTNVLDLTDAQVSDLKALFSKHGITLSAIGSPIGKIRIDEPFEPHLQRFERALHLCKVFNTPNIRIFSYYPPQGGDWNTADEAMRKQVFDRMEQKVRRAEKAGVRLLHENEHRIFGDSPERVASLFRALPSPAFRAAYDPANYVFCGYDPLKGWEMTKDVTAHFHIKDWRAGEPHGRVAGEGQGRIADVMTDAVKRGYDGFATLEPHLLGGGPTGGVTGPELFPKAVAAFKKILDDVGAQYQ